MKFKLLVLFLTVVVCVFGGCTSQADAEQNVDNADVIDTQIQEIAETVLQQEKTDYKLVQPDWSDFQAISYDLRHILSFFHSDYDCTKDDIYDYLFQYNHLDCVYPNDDDVVFVSEPLRESEWDYMRWSLYDDPENDPLGKFPPIPREIYDENGNIDRYFAWDYYENIGTPWLEMCIGYNKFSAEYIDWLVEGVWNGKSNHESFFEFEDGTLLYYHDKYYYTPALAGDRGDGGVYNIHIEGVTRFDNNLIKLEYHLSDDIDRCLSHNTAVIGLKEKEDGSRFWSIFVIDYNYTGNNSDY